MTAAERTQFAAIVRRVTKARAKPDPTDDDTEFLLRLLADRDQAFAELIELEAVAEIEGEKNSPSTGLNR